MCSALWRPIRRAPCATEKWIRLRPRFRDCWALHRAAAFLHVIAAQPTRTRQSGLGTIARWWRSRRHQFVDGGSANLLLFDNGEFRRPPVSAGYDERNPRRTTNLGPNGSIRGPHQCAADAQAIEFSEGNWRRRPDLNRGSRFCRPYRVLFRSAWLRLLVLDDARFSVVFGRCCSEIAPKHSLTSAQGADALITASRNPARWSHGRVAPPTDPSTCWRVWKTQTISFRLVADADLVEYLCDNNIRLLPTVAQ